MHIDLNCDLGEGCGLDAEIMPLITSANVCCGFHAGDKDSVRAALALAKRHNVVVGAHPGYPDREHFGRREVDLAEADVLAECLMQVRALLELAQDEGIAVRYLKPHGALYNQACREDRFARPVVAAARELGLPVLALPGSRLEVVSAGAAHPQDSLRSSWGFVREGFADRRYLPDGMLAPRTQPDAFVTEPAKAVEQALMLVQMHGVRSLCVHGDNPQALAFVRALRDGLQARGLELRAFA